MATVIPSPEFFSGVALEAPAVTEVVTAPLTEDEQWEKFLLDADQAKAHARGEHMVGHPDQSFYNRVQRCVEFTAHLDD